MDEKIKKMMHEAFTGEAKANLKLMVFAEKAEEEGYPQIAKLFKVIALSESIHGKRALRYLKELKSTEENLKESFESEKKVAEHHYEDFIKHSTKVDDRASLTIFTQTRDVEEIHAKLYKEAMNHMLKDVDTVYYICEVCGYVSDGVLPEECPVCGVSKEKFNKFF